VNTPSVLSIYDRSGNFVKPWLDAGFPCIIVDTQHEPGEHTDGLLTRVGADVIGWMPPLRRYAFVASFSPCTDVAVSGARWFQGKGLARLAHAIRLFARGVEIAEWSGAPWLAEHPVSTIATHFRKPDFTFDPCDYGDPYTKKTCLWTGGGFIMPTKQRVEPALGSKMHLLPPSAERANLRSETPMGFARAVFAANAARCIAANGGGA
jgi:hypothetical protein